MAGSRSSSGAKATFTKSAVRDNTAAPGDVGGGIGVFGRVELDRTKVTGNEAGSAEESSSTPSSVRTRLESPILRRALVARNDSALSGGGISIAPGSRLTVSESTIERNDAGGRGGGIHVDRAYTRGERQHDRP